MKNVIVVNCLVLFVCLLSFGEHERTRFNRLIQDNEENGALNVSPRSEKGLFQHRKEHNFGNMPVCTYGVRQPTEREIAVIRGIIKDDFLVNDNDSNAQSPGWAFQKNSSIAIDANGNYVICWEDYRNGNYDIYYQLYNSSGTALGKNVKVNDDIGTRNQHWPSISVDSAGSFIICWYDDRSGNNDIYYQLYNSSGTALGKNVKVNDDTGIQSQGCPSISLNSTGNFIICWQDMRNYHRDIFYQRYYSSGIAIGSNLKANDDTGTAYQYYPSIAMDESGRYVICWYDNRCGNDDIYYQLYNSSGIALGKNVKVNDDTGIQSQGIPSVASDRIGNFIICWGDRRIGNYDIYYQRYDLNGAAIGLNLKVNDDSGAASQSNPSISIDTSGNFIICWEDMRNGDRDIFYQRYSSSGSGIGVNSIVNENIGRNTCFPSISLDSKGGYIICWEDYRNFNYDIYHQRYNSNDSAIGVNVKANDDIGTSYKYFPSIAIDRNGNYIICWEDDRNDNSDIYYQRYNSTGIAIGVNTNANDNIGSGFKHSPSVVIDSCGNYVICWEDPYSGVFYQRYNSSGIAIGTNLKVNSDTGIPNQYHPSMSMNGVGDFVICWQYEYNNDLNIFYQRYNSSGMPIGTNSKANDDTGTTNQCYPSVSMDAVGNYIICWGDFRNGNYDIFYQRYYSSGIAIGSNLKANDDTGTAYQYYPSIAMDESGRYVICWYDNRSGNNDIYYQRYNSSGTALGKNVKVNDEQTTYLQANPSLAIDDAGNFVICWEHWQYGSFNPDIIGQRFHADGLKWGTNYRIVADGPNYGELSPVVAANSSTIAFSWMDNRRSKGWDIYAKLATWDWEGVVNIADKDGKPQTAIKSYFLWRNYPNPFNRTTNIRFALRYAKHTSLRIYDIKGKLIKTLVNEHKPAGNYSIKWNGKNEAGKVVPSGIYIYRIISGGYTSTKTMLIGK